MRNRPGFFCRLMTDAWTSVCSLFVGCSIRRLDGASTRCGEYDCACKYGKEPKNITFQNDFGIFAPPGRPRTALERISQCTEPQLRLHIGLSLC